MILARTDALAVEGFEAAMERAEAYLACGVDALFIEALRTPEQMTLACERFAGRIPLLANMVEGGRTPVLTFEQLEAIGYGLAIFPATAFLAAGAAMQSVYQTLLTDKSSTKLTQPLYDFQDFSKLMGFDWVSQFDQQCKTSDQ